MDFRQYDPSTGRFYTIDLLAEATYSVTPYHFAGNNPVIGSDPTGLLTFFNGMDYSQPKGIQGSQNGYGMINRFGNTEDSFLDNLHSGYGLDPSGGGAFPGSTPYGPGTGYSGGYQGHLDYAEGGHWLKVGTYLVDNPQNNLTYDKYTDGFYRPSQDLILQYKNYYIWQSTSRLNFDDLLGPLSILLGHRFEILKPVAALGSQKGSSIASTTLSKALPIKMPFRLAGTTNLGRMMGRILPFTALGVTATALSIEDIIREVSPTFDMIIGMRDFKFGMTSD